MQKKAYKNYIFLNPFNQVPIKSELKYVNNIVGYNVTNKQLVRV